MERKDLSNKILLLLDYEMKKLMEQMEKSVEQMEQGVEDNEPVLD